MAIERCLTNQMKIDVGGNVAPSTINTFSVSLSLLSHRNLSIFHKIYQHFYDAHTLLNNDVNNVIEQRSKPNPRKKEKKKRNDNVK